MKAIVFTKYGSPDDLELKEVPTPKPKPAEVLVRVHASSINSWDWEYLTGTPFVNRLMFGVVKPKRGKQRLGADIAGTVAAIGASVTRFQVGDAVFGDLWDRWGGFAEYACAEENGLEPKPFNASFEEAASVPQAGVLALQAFRQGAPTRSGGTVLINGAGGGVGTFAIQMAKLSGAEVTGVDAAHKLDTARAVGADHVIDFAEHDFADGDKIYDLIIDCQGTRSMSDINRVLASDGTYAMIGGEMKRVRQLWMRNALAALTQERRKLRLVFEGPNKGLSELKALMEAGNLAPVIDKTFSLAQVPDALRYFAEGQHKGKIAISIAPAV